MKTEHVLGCLLTLFCSTAFSHSFSDSFLTIEPTESALKSTWHVSIQDLELAIGLDINQDGAITWRELNSRKPQIEAYAFSQISYNRADAPCDHRNGELLVDDKASTPFAVLQFVSTCQAGTAEDPLAVNYRPMFERDPQHRGFIKLAQSDAPPLIARAEDTQVSFARTTTTSLIAFNYVKEGVWHIWTGIDHILFVLTLLLGVLAGRVAIKNPSSQWMEALKIVTAFTISHSATLALGAYEIVRIPSAWVEILIAASIAVAALANFNPRLDAYRITIAFVFGLIHGLGFAGVLTNIDLTGSPFVIALLSFNIGVEFGQVVIVAWLLIAIQYIRLPANIINRAQPTKIGSGALAIVGIGWTVSRIAG